jgi:hypothetical protein
LGKNTYAGVFVVALATLMYEILLTRIFSVSMWYHFAFLAVSVAMFGITVGALIVYLLPQYFTRERVHHHLSLSCLLFGLTIVFSFLTHLSIPIPFDMDRSIVTFYSLGLNFAVLSIPFVFSGICICLALTKFPRKVNTLYATDLAGAAAGCILLVYSLKITDGPTAVIVVAFLAAAGAVLFTLRPGSSATLRRIAVVCSLTFVLFAGLNTVLASRQLPLLRLLWVKGGFEARPLYEQWNSFSRIAITGDPDARDRPLGTGLSPTFPADRKVRQLSLAIDAAALTLLTHFDGNLASVEHTKYEVSNLGHYIRPGSDVLVIGPGGGGDILAALAFHQKSVLAVEMNKDIIYAVNDTFGDFTGHLDKNPKVRFVADEARSYLARTDKGFDIIQITLIDTWAATAAGAFVLSEHSLYTVEAWDLFLSRLTSRGVLTVSRWYFRENPVEMYRLTSLAVASLKNLGVDNPRRHIAIVRSLKRSGEGAPEGIGTLLVGRDPFTDEDLATIRKIAEKMKFDLVLSPDFSLDPTFAAIASGSDLNKLAARHRHNIAPPTDDKPFFFHMLRLSDIFDRELRRQGSQSRNLQAVLVLGLLLVVVGGLTFLCIIVPLVLTTEKACLRGTLAFFVFFAGIGMGFMLVELSQMQRLIIFLGHPTYGLSVVLFSLLLSSGLGSYSTQRVGNPGFTTRATGRLLLLMVVVVLFGLLTPDIIRQFEASATSVRILVATGILFPLGLFMGMPFPLGFRLAAARSDSLTPWLWGINGASSVLASVMAVVIAMELGISTSFWSGAASYAVAVGAFAWACRNQQ